MHELDKNGIRLCNPGGHVQPLQPETDVAGENSWEFGAWYKAVTAQPLQCTYTEALHCHPELAGRHAESMFSQEIAV